MIKEGCVIIDVGMNAVDDPNDKRGYHLCGDVDYASVMICIALLICSAMISAV
jgi:5,10-methylene-tetrahydrofolate dehydrogenase/methenyl tetrahydrofolate cyclohydrolase